MVKNIGIADATSTVLKFNTSDKDIIISDSLITFDVLEPGAEDTTKTFEFEVAPFNKDGEIIVYGVEITSDNGYHSTYENEMTIVSGNPKIVFFPKSLNGEIEKLNDSLTFDITIENDGYGDLIYQIENPIQQIIDVGTHGSNWWLPLKNGTGMQK